MSDLEELRDAYSEHTLGHKPCTSLDDWAGERFDAILAQHDREVAAEAWDAAVKAMRYEDGTPVELVSVVNPYRATHLHENGDE